MTTMLVTDQADLRRCEEVIESGMQTFVEVGNALAEIKAKKLYRDTHKTFASYCKDKWGKSRQWADVTIQSAETAVRIENDKLFVKTAPTSTQAAALSRAPEELQTEVWESVSEEAEAAGERVTVAKVKAAVARVGDDGLPPVAPQHVVDTTKARKKASDLVGKLIRALHEAGLYESHRTLLSSLCEELGV